MEYLVNLYTQKPELLSNLFDRKVNISVKIDGSAFQISNEDGDIKFRKRGGSSSKLGPVIDEYTKLFAKQLNKAIEYFGKPDGPAASQINNNKFLAIELIEDGDWVLLTAIDKHDRVINAGKELDNIASDMAIASVPLLYDDVLTKQMKTMLIDLMTLSPDTSNEEFINLIYKIFKIEEGTTWNDLLKDNEIEGIVLTWDIDGKLAQYKIINPSFKKRHEAEMEEEKRKAEANRDDLNNLLKLLVDRMEEKADKLAEDNLKSLELNFLRFANDPKFFNKLISTAAKVMPNENRFFFLQVKRTSKDIQKMITKYGTPIVTAYEQYLMTFHKERKRNYIISPEFQERINKLVTSI